MRASLKLTALIMSACFIISCGYACKKQSKETEIQKTTISASLDSSFQLMHNQTAVIEPENLSIKFVNVTEDSRCPVGVECIWAGQAKIEVEIKREDEEPEIIVLTSQAGREELAEMQVKDYFIKLLKVEPPRQKDVELKLSDYNITLIASRNIENLSQ
ncbi:MAG: hypothetical protein JSW64_07740 [Candidatus Zixiibacteriota bacterium]|nr:MAG: hypothetical protein JSW64_07740 [candidate division Zixibacteria bacterium]